MPAQQAGSSSATNDPIARIRDEGLNRSQVMKIVGHLTDVIGPRLTGSPQLKRANEWTCDQFTAWGLTNAHLEPWGPSGRGWSLRRFSAQLIEPQAMPLIALPRAWSPGIDYPLVGDVIYLEATQESDLEKYKGKLKGSSKIQASTTGTACLSEFVRLPTADLQSTEYGPAAVGGAFGAFTLAL